MPSDNLNYTAHVKGKNAEEILAAQGCDAGGPLGEYLRLAAQVRTHQELAAALDGLDDDQRIEVLALMWLGRGDFERA